MNLRRSQVRATRGPAIPGGQLMRDEFTEQCNSAGNCNTTIDFEAISRYQPEWIDYVNGELRSFTEEIHTTRQANKARTGSGSVTESSGGCPYDLTRTW